MIINPFLNDNNKNEKINIINLDDKNEFINQTIEYIFDNYGDGLLNNSNNRTFIIKIIEERVQNKFLDKKEIKEITNIIVNKFYGYDILQKYIDNSEITDIRAVSFDLVYVKIKGSWIKTDEKFNSDKEFNNFVRGCIFKNGGKINNENPLIVVSDKSNNLRIEAGISPVNVVSASIVIRIHRNNTNDTLEKLLVNESFMFNMQIYKFLLGLIEKEKNIVISGKGGSGKTTLLRALLKKVGNNKSLVINEETSEIFLEGMNVIQRECVKNKSHAIDLDTLSKQSMLMSNDIIVVGEIKGEETFNFLDAISTGHVGYATVHANNSKNTIDRINLLVKRNIKANTYSSEFIERFLASNIDYIIYMQNFKIKEILEIKYNNKPEYVMLYDKNKDVLVEYNY